jgi:hypothetical protein
MPIGLLAALVAATACAACGDENAEPRRIAAPPPPDHGDREPDFPARRVVVPATNRRTALLTAVRVGSHPGFDRVVFVFRRALPGYDVGYVRRPVRADGSGRVVPVPGRAVAGIRMENALDADLSQESAPLTYTGPRRLAPRLPALVALARTGGFEGVLTWVAGVRERSGFRVTVLRSPPRLVVDFEHR